MYCRVKKHRLQSGISSVTDEGAQSQKPQARAIAWREVGSEPERSSLASLHCSPPDHVAEPLVLMP